MKRFVQITLILILVISSTLVVQGKGLDLPRGQTTPPRKIFLPIMAKMGGYAITGQVTDDQEQPVAGVSVTDQYGHTVISDQNGNYTLSGLTAGNYELAPAKEGYVFSPSVGQVEVSGASGTQNFSGFTACAEAMVNGSFEIERRMGKRSERRIFQQQGPLRLTFHAHRHRWWRERQRALHDDAGDHHPRRDAGSDPAPVALPNQR